MMSSLARKIAIAAADPPRAFRFALATATALMIVLSWPLWNGDEGAAEIPRVPWIAGLDPPANLGARLIPWGALAALGWLATNRRPRWAASCALALGSWLVLFDQHRLQPWMQQFLAMTLALAVAPSDRALGYCRLYLVALYFHSGLSKLDWSFTQEIGANFLRTMTPPLGLDSDQWSAPWRIATVLAMPVGEIGIALTLGFAKTRRWGVGLAVAMHAILIAVLGPWALDQSTIVLVWNAALAIQVAILFQPAALTMTSDEPGRWEGIARLAMLAVVVAPFFERSGLWDSWPSFALYASHCERTLVYVAESEDSAGVDRLPPSARRCLIADDSVPAPWRRLDLTVWSRSTRGTPVYPQNRACAGLAEFLAERATVMVIREGRADRWTGRRERVKLLGLPAIREHSRESWLNARPRPIRP